MVRTVNIEVNVTGPPGSKIDISIPRFGIGGGRGKGCVNTYPN